MSTLQNFNAFDLLGQAGITSPAVHLPGRGGPRLEILWGSFHQSLASSLKTLFDGTRAPREFLGANYFRDCWIERRVPYRALLAAVLWHTAFLLLSPLFNLRLAPRHIEAFENTELTWSGPINDLPLLNVSAAKPKPVSHAQPDKPVVAKGADTFHPRQRIFTDSAHPTHPRQTLINFSAPPEAPKILPNLPNVVQIQQLAVPARPRLEISGIALQKLRPREKKRSAAVTDESPPDVSNFEQRPADANFAPAQDAPAKPKLPLNAGVVPRVAQHAQTGDVNPAPEVGEMQSNGPSSAFIALSATPAPPATNVAPPQGNLSAHISISPEVKQTSPAVSAASGVLSAGGSSNASNGAGKNAMDVSISGGNPPAKNGVSGAGGSAKFSAPKARLLLTRPEAKSQVEEIPLRTGPPNFAALPPGAKPEEIFTAKHFYTLNVNMPNLNSATGSWIMNFSQMGGDVRTNATDLAGPVPLRKVDPKYPRTLINERVEGEVILYAVIRSDGTVDSIQLVRGIDQQLDANAMSALSQWRFQPAARKGAPVELEAIVHIPFRAQSAL